MRPYAALPSSGGRTRLKEWFTSTPALLMRHAAIARRREGLDAPGACRWRSSTTRSLQLHHTHNNAYDTSEDQRCTAEENMPAEQLTREAKESAVTRMADAVKVMTGDISDGIKKLAQKIDDAISAHRTNNEAMMAAIARASEKIRKMEQAVQAHEETGTNGNGKLKCEGRTYAEEESDESDLSHESISYDFDVIGTKVILHDLSRQELNGARGEVMSIEIDDRVGVRVEGRAADITARRRCLWLARPSSSAAGEVPQQNQRNNYKAPKRTAEGPTQSPAHRGARHGGSPRPDLRRKEGHTVTHTDPPDREGRTAYHLHGYSARSATRSPAPRASG